MAIKPEDMIPDENDFAHIKGISIRKGSFAALLANAHILNASESSDAEKFAAKTCFFEVISILVAMGIHECITWKNSELQALMERAVQERV